MTYSQIISKIEFSGNQKQVKETQKLLDKYNIYFVLSDNEEIKATFTKDSLLIIEAITNDQIKQIKNQEFILVKFQNKKSCFYSLFPNGFTVYKSIKNLMIYKSTKKRKLKDKRYTMSFLYVSKGMSLSTPLSLIPCSEYKGEYDNGLEGYLSSIKNE
jgi:hypothetical protein